MKKYIKYIPLIIIIVLLTIGASAFFAHRKRPDSTNYISQNGNLNLKNWNWSESPVIELNGEWNFYPDILKEELSKSDSVIKNVPHFWESDTDLDFSPYGFGTYHLNVSGLNPDDIYALQITDEVTAYRLYVNDKIVAQNGKPGASKDNSRPQWKPLQAAFSSDDHGRAVFIMEISNYDYYRGGFWNNIKIGSLENIIRQSQKTNLMDMFLATSILLIGFLNLFLFFLYKKRGKAPLFFSFFCFSMGLRVLVTGQRLVTGLLPSLDWHFLVKAEYLLGYLLLPLFGLFAINLFDEYPGKKFLRKLFYTLAVISILFVIFTPNSVYTIGLAPYKWVSIIYIISFIYSIFRVNIQNTREIILLIIASIGIFISIIKETIVGGSVSWLPFATLNVIVCFTFITFLELFHFIQKNELLGMRAFLDPLTGLFNRAYLKELEASSSAPDNTKETYLMFMDLDSFKVINDTYGHKIGDFILQETGKRLKNLLRNTDVVCRYGGDEFVIIIDDCEENIKIIAERILQKIKEPFIQEEKSFSISASIGITKVHSGWDEIETMIRNSDNAMYTAKQNGKNQYYLWESNA